MALTPFVTFGTWNSCSYLQRCSDCAGEAAELLLSDHLSCFFHLQILAAFTDLHYREFCMVMHGTCITFIFEYGLSIRGLKDVSQFLSRSSEWFSME